MQQLEHEQQQQILSEQHKHHKKIQKYKQYLVSSGCVLHLIKFLLGIRNKQKADDSVPNDDVLKMFYQYIGAVPSDNREQEELKQSLEKERQENQRLKGEIQGVKREVEERKIAREKAAEEKRLRQEEEAAKNSKKGGKR